MEGEISTLRSTVNEQMQQVGQDCMTACACKYMMGSGVGMLFTDV